jgi:hypothetical protein
MPTPKFIRRVNIYIFDNKGKAEILNKQYDSIFTDENLEQTPQLGNSSVPSIDQLNITENGVCTLLKKLDPTKAMDQTRYQQGY